MHTQIETPQPHFHQNFGLSKMLKCILTSMEPVPSILFDSCLQFIYSEKATKFCEIFTLLLSYVVPVKSKVKIFQNFVAFSEYMNFTSLQISIFWNNCKQLTRFELHRVTVGKFRLELPETVTEVVTSKANKSLKFLSIEYIVINSPRNVRIAQNIFEVGFFDARYWV